MTEEGEVTSLETSENPPSPSKGYDTLDQRIMELLTDCYIEDGNIIGYFTEETGIGLLISLLRTKGYSFSIRDSDDRKKKFSSGENVEEGKSSTIFYNLKGSVPIKFFGIPFCVEKTTMYICSNGCKYYKLRAEKFAESNGEEVDKYRRTRKSASRKLGCLARMALKKVVCFPDFPLDDIKKWRTKKKIIEELRSDLKEKPGNVKQSFRHYLAISMKNRHNHPPRPEFASGFVWDRGVSKPKKTKTESPVEPTYPITLEPFNVQEEEPEPEPIFENVGDVYIPEDAQVVLHYSTIDLQELFKDKLKRLYTLSESCTNPALLVKLLSELEGMDEALVSDAAVTFQEGQN